MKWKEEDIKDLIFMVKDLQLPYYEISDIIGRSRGAIEQKCKHLNLVSSYNKKKTTKSYKKELPSDIILLEDYVNDKTKINHKHLTCGHIWKVRPNNIISGYKCPICSCGYSKGIPAFTYCIYFKDLDVYKVGVTNNIKTRMANFGYKPEIIFIREFNNGNDALILEKLWLYHLKDYLVNTYKLKSGNTETFKIKGDIFMASEWTEELKAQVIEDYTSKEPTAETSTEIVKSIAEDIDMTVNGVRSVLVRAKVYVKKTPATGGSTGGDKPASTRVNKADAIKALKDIISNNSMDVDDTIVDKLTGKAAVYFTGIFEGLTSKES